MAVEGKLDEMLRDLKRLEMGTAMAGVLMNAGAVVKGAMSGGLGAAQAAAERATPLAAGKARPSATNVAATMGQVANDDFDNIDTVRGSTRWYIRGIVQWEECCPKGRESGWVTKQAETLPFAPAGHNNQQDPWTNLTRPQGEDASGYCADLMETVCESVLE